MHPETDYDKVGKLQAELDKANEIIAIRDAEIKRLNETINDMTIGMGQMSKEIVELNEENEKLKQMVLRYRPVI